MKHFFSDLYIDIGYFVRNKYSCTLPGYGWGLLAVLALTLVLL